MEISSVNAAYIAGLFDGEGNVMCKQYMRKKKGSKKAYKVWYIRCEVAMIDEFTIKWLKDVLGFGWVAEKRYNNKPKYKKQWRWCCGHQNALKFAKIIWPYAQVKLHKIEQIIDHYEPEHNDHNVVSLEHYKMWMKDEKR